MNNRYLIFLRSKPCRRVDRSPETLPPNHRCCACCSGSILQVCSIVHTCKNHYHYYCYYSCCPESNLQVCFIVHDCYYLLSMFCFGQKRQYFLILYHPETCPQIIKKPSFPQDHIFGQDIKNHTCY